MLVKPIIVSIGLVASGMSNKSTLNANLYVLLASATLNVHNLLFGRQAATMPLPDQCTAQCPIIQQVLTLAAANFGPYCTTSTEDQIVACYTCIETYAPGELSPQALTYAQTGINNFVAQCANLGVRPVQVYSLGLVLIDSFRVPSRLSISPERRGLHNSQQIPLALRL